MRFALIVVILLSLPVQAQLRSIPAIRDNNTGVAHLEKEEPFLAYKDFLKSLKNDPLNPAIHLNLGFAHEKNKDGDSATKEYLTAAQLSKDPESKFYGLFNAANLLGQSGKIPEALRLYQLALEIRPDSQEVKTNIELLWKGGKGKGDGEGGGGKDKKDDDKGGGKNQDQSQKQDPKDQPGPGNDPKPEPKPFNSKELTKSDVQKILEELKSQEQQIRARVYNEKTKTKPNDKDW